MNFYKIYLKELKFIMYSDNDILLEYLNGDIENIHPLILNEEVWKSKHLKAFAKQFGFRDNMTPDEAKKHFHKMAQQYHSDSTHDPKTDEEFKKLNAAYQWIKKGRQEDDDPFSGFSSSSSGWGSTSDFWDYVRKGAQRQTTAEEQARQERAYQQAQEADRAFYQQEKERKKEFYKQASNIYDRYANTYEAFARDEKRNSKEHEEKLERNKKLLNHLSKTISDNEKTISKYGKKQMVGGIATGGSSAILIGSLIKANKLNKNNKYAKDIYNKYLLNCKHKKVKPLSFESWKAKEIKKYKTIGILAGGASLAGGAYTAHSSIKKNDFKKDNERRKKDFNTIYDNAKYHQNAKNHYDEKSKNWENKAQEARTKANRCHDEYSRS